MTLSVAAESPLTPEGRALVEGSQLALQEVFAAEDIFSFSAEELAKPGVSFLVAREQGQALGCVAIVKCGDYVEVKRLYVPAAGRGRGIARALMAALETRVRAENIRFVRLETGDLLTPAVTLYLSLGYKKCGRFGDYADHPASVFMEKTL